MHARTFVCAAHPALTTPHGSGLLGSLAAMAAGPASVRLAASGANWASVFGKVNPRKRTVVFWPTARSTISSADCGAATQVERPAPPSCASQAPSLALMLVAQSPSE